MEFIKKFFNDDKKIIGLCGFKDEDNLDVYIPKFDPSKQIYTTNCEKNFFLL